MDFKEIPIDTILPQKPPFVMIEHLTDFTMERTATSFTVTADNIYTGADGRLSRYALLENIAQTCAARIGYANVYIYKRPVKLGFIGAIKDLRIHRQPLVGEVLDTVIDVVQDVMGITLVDATARVGEEIIAQGTMKIALSDIDAA